MRTIAVTLSLLGVLLVPLSIRRALALTSGNRLVYAFTYSSSQDVSARDSSTPAESVSTGTGGSGKENAGSQATGYSLGGSGSGISHYSGSQSDKGTITVDVVHQQPDGGLIVNISEQGENGRSAPPATCVVYGNTRAICDPNKTVNSEEYTLLRFLGTNFVDANQLDANRHWSEAQNGSGQSTQSDYKIDSDQGGAMQISETRKIRPANGSQTTDVQTKIGYDMSRAIPTSVDEYVTQRNDSGVSGTSTTTYQTTLKLVSTTAVQP